MPYGPIELNLKRNSDFTEQSTTLMTKYYMHESDNTIQDALARPALAFCGGDSALAQRIYNYASKKWFMYASPILSNAPSITGVARGLPISCYLSHVPDTLQGLMEHTTETRWLAVKGGGVGGNWSSVRAISGIAPGPLPFLNSIDADMVAYKQGTTRKGSYAAYLDISHPDIIEFINIRVPTGGAKDVKCFNINNAVNIPDKFMEAVKSDTSWDLICPHNGEVHETLQARDLWQRLLEVRYRTGEPYLNFIDTANAKLPKAMIDKGLRIKGSNLCGEIHLPTDENRTAVCCLSSLNLEKWEEWKDTNIVEDLTIFLDNVLTYFIENAPPELNRAKFSASQERSIGIGAMGFHSLLQNNNIEWESEEARALNKEIFKTIKARAKTSTIAIAEELGACPDVPGVRNAHLLAIAPNANSGILCGTSASIEPIKSNAYVHRTRIGTHMIKNRALKKVLEAYNKDTKDIWQDIVGSAGSVQHLEFLTPHEKKVFKTCFELNQEWVIRHAADRQPEVCQGQSVNVFFKFGADKRIVNRVHLLAYKLGLKGLYYLRTTRATQAGSLNAKITREELIDYTAEECQSCSG